MEHEHVDSKKVPISPGFISVNPEADIDLLNHLTKETEMETNQDKPKHVPSNLFDSKEKYLAFKQKWSELAAKKQLSATMMVFYNVVRGLSLELGFTPITNTVKLENGQKPNGAYINASASVHGILFPQHEFQENHRKDMIGVFAGTIDDEFMTKVSNYFAKNPNNGWLEKL